MFNQAHHGRVPDALQPPMDGRITGDATRLSRVRPGGRVKLTRLEG